MWFKSTFRRRSKAGQPRDGKDKDGTTLTAEHVEHQENVDKSSSRPLTAQQLHEQKLKAIKAAREADHTHTQKILKNSADLLAYLEAKARADDEEWERWLARADTISEEMSHAIKGVSHALKDISRASKTNTDTMDRIAHTLWEMVEQREAHHKENLAARQNTG